MSAFVLKLIAMISMLFDHTGYIIFNSTTFFNYIGRFAFPIFAFQISEGYIHTKNLSKYFFRLFVFALISQAPFMLFQMSVGFSLTLNIFFTLIFGLLAIFIYDKCKFKFVGIICAVLLAIMAQYLKFDYGAFGVAIIFLFYVFKNKKLLMSLSFILAVIIKNLVPIIFYGFNFNYILFALFTILSLVFILTYNNKKGRNIKYLLYFFYPAHLLILYLISL